MSSRPAVQPLGEMQFNHQGRNSPTKMNSSRERSKSPSKKAFNLGLKSKPSDDGEQSRDGSPRKPKKTKSVTNFASLLTRPKSLRNLRKQDSNDDGYSSTVDKENQAPDASGGDPPPIWAELSSEGVSSPRPLSTQSPTRGRPLTSQPSRGHMRSKSVAAGSAAMAAELAIDPKDINAHLEALLDRRNIPENQRYKMRNLTDTIKMEFIRQDWAEMQAAKGGDALTQRTSSNSDRPATDVEVEDDEPRRTRGRSFTFSRGRKDSRSPSKKSRRDRSISRHFRTKSTENLVEDRPESSASSAGIVSGFFSNLKLQQQGPSDFVEYLRKQQRPQQVEVGRIHKLRILLRNETVSWTEQFIQQGGIEEIVGLLNRIMDVEWREEHEDALLHENLLCLKALSTTALAIAYIDKVRDELMPKLLHLIFDPEKKGPSEFTTRNIITSILLTYISSAIPAERVIRAKNVLGYLRDPKPKEEERPLAFVLDMHQERPYRVWCKEAVNVTKEVFWIFLHNMNVISLPPQEEQDSFFPPAADTSYSYMTRHFPHERPPVAAAPYVGGVEWDATNYIASHLDLMNAIIACTATQDGRNHIREQLRISGWERCLGGSLRLCKEKFYGSVHEALRTWVAAAAEDGWNVVDVRFGPPPKEASRSASPQKGKKEDAPKLDMPKFDLGF